MDIVSCFFFQSIRETACKGAYSHLFHQTVCFFVKVLQGFFDFCDFLPLIVDRFRAGGKAEAAR